MDVAACAYLEARTSLFSAQLWRHEQRQTLLGSAPDELSGLLSQAGLAELTTTPPSDPTELEQRLTTRLIEESEVLTRGMNSAARDFIHHWLRRFELINLKLILRTKLAGWSSQATLHQLLELGSLAMLPLQTLAETENIEEFLRRLESTRYAAMARHVRKAYEEQRSLFDAETILDSHYFHQLVYLSNALQGPHRQQLRQQLGLYLDQVNLAALLRYRFTYAMAPPHAYFLLAPGGRHLPLSLLQELAQQDSLSAVVANLPRPLNSDLSGATTIQEVENHLVMLTRAGARNLLQHQTFNMARAFAYIYLREQQLQLVHTVLKGHMLGLDPALIHSSADPLANPLPESGQQGATS